jgi:hypothetical protein
VSKPSSLQEANYERHVLSLIRKHGLSGAKRALESEGKSYCLATLRKRAEAAGVKIPGRGRPTVYDWPKIVKLLKKFKSHAKVRAHLTEKGEPCPTNPMLVKVADKNGIEITRGRPVKDAA